MEYAHQQPQVCVHRLQMHKGNKNGWRVSGQEELEQPRVAPTACKHARHDAAPCHMKVRTSLNQSNKRKCCRNVQICACPQCLAKVVVSYHKSGYVLHMNKSQQGLLAVYLMPGRVGRGLKLESDTVSGGIGVGGVSEKNELRT